MTAFVLVGEAFTGSWVWREVAERLWDAGEEAYPVALTGLGELRHVGGPETDLETHIRDVVRVIDEKAGGPDAAGGPHVVLVGHGYGIHPVLGAAGQRVERIARVVHLDAGLPDDGAPALALVPDQEVRDRLAVAASRAGSADETADDLLIRPPAADEWSRWGSTEGITAEMLGRLTARAAPQPAATLTQPMRIPDAVAALPATGVLCTANGVNIAMVEALIGLGDAKTAALADPRITFFELATGHWPMLSCPGEVTEVLRAAARDEGHRLTAAKGEPPAHLRPFLTEVAECARERVGNIDLHLPDGDGPWPAVVFVHGGPVPAEARPTPRDWPAFLGYARYAAALGAVGVTLDHGLHDITDFARAAHDVAEAVELVRADPRVDGDRVALWFFSVGALLSADWLAAPPPWLRCVAATYPVLAPMANWAADTGTRFRPATAVRDAGKLPIIVTRVGRENPPIAATVERFLTAAEAGGADVEVIDVPHGRHGFETVDPTDESREAVDRAMRTVLARLRD